jgi:hypothetical protein
MTAHELGFIVQSCIALLSLGALWFWLFADYRCDKFRQKMFALRDEMFDFVSKEDDGFDLKAYRDLRELMNSLIRFAHRVSFCELLLLSLRSPARRVPSDFSQRFEAGLREIKSGRTKNELKRYHDRAFKLVAGHILTGSLGMMALSACLVALAAVFPSLFEPRNSKPKRPEPREEVLRATVRKMPVRELERCAMAYEGSPNDETLLASV